MTIRRRLASFIVLMITFLVIMGGLLQLGGPIIVGAFRESLDAMNSLNAIRELKFNINRQKTALNRYLLLSDQQELLSYNEAAALSQENLNDIGNPFKKNKPDWFVEILDLHKTSHDTATRIIGQYKSGDKAQAHDVWARDLFPKLQKLSERVDQVGEDETQRAQAMFRQIKGLSRNVGVVVSIVFAVAILAGLFLFRSLYRAVMNPLESLKEGANKFGKGHLEHRIKVPPTNEFGSLAESFNQMAENINQLQLQAVHMDRMSAVGQLAGGVAHEINNPLTAVLGQAQILMAKIKSDDPKHGQLKKIENAAIRCRKIVRGLLDFSRPSQSRFDQVDVNGMVVATLDLCEADLKKGRVVVEKKLSESVPRIKANMSELQQVLLNLVNNAIQAMPQGGRLVLETKNHNKKGKKSPTSSSPSVLSGSWVEISVKDNGIGISQDHVSRIFDPFFTTKDIGKGTGLGLSVSTGIIQKHGGELMVESPGINKGTTFKMILPVRGSGMGGRSKSKPGLAA